MKKLLWIILAINSFASCFVDHTLPKGAIVPCNNGGCPSGYSCNTQTNRCVANGKDGTPPSVLQFTSDDTLYGTARTITMTFSVTEMLSQNPIVTLNIGDLSRQATFESQNGLEYVYLYIVDATDAGSNATPVTVSVQVSDLADNSETAEFPDIFAIETGSPALLSTPTVLLEPPVTNLLWPQVDAVTIGTRVRFTLTFDEILAAPPIIRATDSGANSVANIILQSDRNPSFEFAWTSSKAGSNGDYIIYFDATDVAGNTATNINSTAGFALLTTPPCPPTNLRYVRDPLGTSPTLTPQSSIEALDPLNPSVGNGEHIYIFDAPTTPRFILGGTSALVNGVLSNPFVVQTGDRPIIYVAAVDRAGNESTVVEVENVSWKASLRGKISGNEFPNPHKIKTLASSEPALFSDFASEPATANIQRLADIDDEDLQIQHSRRWTRRSSNSPPGSVGGSLVHMSSIAKSFLLFGSVGDGGLTSTWEWNGESWRSLTIIGLEPAARIGTTGTYDSLRDRIVVFGGAASLTNLYTDTWEWDGTSWVDVTPSANPMEAHLFSNSSYDRTNQQVIVFGGVSPEPPAGCASNFVGSNFGGTNACVRNDIWTWDGQTWRERCAGTENCGTLPPARHSAVFVYDPVHQSHLLFGGWSPAVLGQCPDGEPPVGAFCVLTDTWELQLSENSATWTPRTPLAHPSGRYGAGGIYDPSANNGSGGIQVVAGCTNGDFYECYDALNDFWSWNGNNWQPVVTTGKAIERRGYPQITFDTARNHIVLFGGNESVRLADTLPPIATCDDNANGGANAVVCDDGNTAPMRHGSPNETCVCDWSKTWVLSDNTWRTVSSVGDGIPEAVRNLALAYDSQREVSVLFGGGGTTNCDGFNEPSNTCRTVWEYDGTSWLMRWPLNGETDPTPRSQHSLAYWPNCNLGPGIGCTVLFGNEMRSSFCGNDPNCEFTWGWNGTTWIDLAPSSPFQPSRRGLAAMASSGTDVYLFGGGRYESAPPCDASELTTQTPPDTICLNNEFWKLSYNAPNYEWQRLFPGGGDPWPDHRAGHRMAYDANRNELVLFGGCNEMQNYECATNLTPGFNDTWVWDVANGGWSLKTFAPGTPIPSPRANHSMSYDDSRGRIILFGGDPGTGGANNQTWEWDGSVWTQVFTVGPTPPPRRNHDSDFDSARKKLVLVGGSSPKEVWEWDLDSDQRPAALLSFSFDKSGVQASSMSGLTLRLAGAGVGYAPAAVSGLEIALWHSAEARWDVLSGNSLLCNEPVVPISIQDVYACTVTDPVRAQSYVFSGTQQIYARIRTRGGIGSANSPPTINLNYVELTVDYAVACSNCNTCP